MRLWMRVRMRCLSFRKGQSPMNGIDRLRTMSTFVAILQLFLRSWPFIRPEVMGRWWSPKAGLATEIAEDIAGSDYHFYYAPVLVALIAVGVPWIGWLPWQDAAVQFYALYAVIAVVVVGFTYLAVAPGRLQFQAAALTVFMAFLGTVATVVIDGHTDSLYMVAITAGRLLGWMVQIRKPGRKAIEAFRVRLSAHLIYLLFNRFRTKFRCGRDWSALGGHDQYLDSSESATV